MGFSVATWNVLAQAYVRPERYAHCAPGALEAKARLRLLLERAAALDVDVLLLQEVEPDVHAALTEHLKWSGLYAQREGRPDGASVLTRLPVRGHEVLRYQAPGGEGQLALIVELSDAVVASTHLQWRPDGTSPDRHPGRLQLIELLNRVDARPWVIGGDFNAVPESDVLREAFARGFVETAVGPTCNIHREARQIDYLLSKGLSAAARPRRSLGDDEPLPSSTEPSDHLPAVARFG
jgi:endonuclease/exonuclease/phosphatase family metal-dependent hydrolase